ncbi:MAG: ATP-binding protein [Acidobacteriaceae bacterium]|nr:ATP-binding protein [Acidobacteriaceae bacterium]
MPSRQKPKKKSSAVGRLKGTSKNGTRRSRNELVVITGMSGSGKASVLKAFEDLGYYCVDNLPIELIPQFAELAQNSEYERTALVVDIREGSQFRKLPSILKSLKNRLQTKVIFLEASEDALIRRFSETRRPHPLGKSQTVSQAIATEREQLNEIRNASDFIIDTSKFNVHDLRAHALDKFRRNAGENVIAVSCLSFGYKHGVPQDCDLLFDVRFLPNPHFIPELRPFTGRDAKVAKYVLSFPQSREFIDRVSKMLIYLLPHYVKEGKSYLTIGFGCTGGQHRSVLIAEEVRKRLAAAKYNVSVTHRDSPE